MTAQIREARKEEVEELFPILLHAEESESALRWSIDHLSDALYRMDDGNELVGAATVQWRDDPCEIIELAVRPEHRGRGLGKGFVHWLIEEARRRGKRQLFVGTANSSIPNIAFYQKCGLRMDHVRQDYFWYYRGKHYENGIQVRDMLVFSYNLDANPKRVSTRNEAR